MKLMKIESIDGTILYAECTDDIPKYNGIYGKILLIEKLGYGDKEYGCHIGMIYEIKKECITYISEKEFEKAQKKVIFT